MRMVKSALELELERGFDERLQRELAAAEKAKDVAAHRRHIVDKLLVLACPRCAQVFVDFEGCFALTVEKKYKKFQVVFRLINNVFNLKISILTVLSLSNFILWLVFG